MMPMSAATLAKSKAHVMKRVRLNPKGFTLLEILVALAVVVLVAVGGFSLFSSRAGLELESEARSLASLYSQAHDDAMFRNATIRIVINLEDDPQKYWAESSSGKVLLQQSVETNLLTKFEMERLHQKAESRNQKFSKDALQEDEKELPRNMKILWVKKSTGRVIDDGMVATHFFPSGRSEADTVKIQDENGNAFTIKINPITGKILVEIDEAEIDEENLEEDQG